jgi:hypothetical protein
MWVSGGSVVSELRKPLEQGKPVLGVLTLDGKAYVLEKASAKVGSSPATRRVWDEYEKGKAARNTQGEGEPPPF